MRILLVTLSNIGDAVMTTPVMERLHELYPRAVIDLVADRRSSPLFQRCPYLGRIHHKDKKKGWRGVLQLVGRLRETRYDLVVDLRTDGLALLLRARKRLMKWGRRPYGPHAVEDLISILRPIDPDAHIPAMRLWLDPEDLENADRLLAPLPGKRWLAMAPGANSEHKIWPAARFAALAERLRDRFDACVLLGSPADRPRSRAVAERLALPVRDLTGQTDLLTAAAVLARMDLFVGNDSGLGHMAAAVDTPTVTVFGPGQPERYHPWGPRARWVVQPDADLDRLSVDEVARAARESVAT